LSTAASKDAWEANTSLFSWKETPINFGASTVVTASLLFDSFWHDQIKFAASAAQSMDRIHTDGLMFFIRKDI
jgi:hypothetical protein